MQAHNAKDNLPQGEKPMTGNGRTERRDDYSVTKTRSPLRSAVNPLVMRITTQAGMVNIDNEDIAYGNIRNIYTTGDGVGLQLSERLEHKRGEIIDMCDEIADRIYALQDILLS